MTPPNRPHDPRTLPERTSRMATPLRQPAPAHQHDRPPAVTRLVIVHHQPAIRAGLRALLDPASGLQVVGEAAAVDGRLGHLLYRTRPDIVLLEDRAALADDDVNVCRQIKDHALAPMVLIAAEHVDPALIAAATLADADGLFDTAAGETALRQAIRSAAGGQPTLPKL